MKKQEFSFNTLANQISNSIILERDALKNLKGGADDPPPTTDDFD